ncbi:NADH-quinone oxidoreductase subunit L [Candidatus Deferrimicrobium sp.]|uniref:NADH-quinone oxidoreductase subunit L n=1 Tax=Candidatus Deferrimicrobium sp. TaxID=3060586 RepID=UPI002722EF7C|nr:NADH-quinone oxidoreductase subunit L [Candidatus Deferrimicrobium sp.]MDO8739363.1 NADH-quinone oxidoreductase subunit L [Candidatus Deferrimicrobium sp.]
MVNGILDYLWLVPALPLLGVVLNGAIALFAERPFLLADSDGGPGESHGHAAAPAYRKLVAFIAPAVVGAAFVVALLCVLSLASRPADGRTFVQILFPWIQAGSLLVPAALQLDPLSSVMALVVTGVGFLIHVYSVGYMSHERAFARYFVFLNLFMFAMLTLVLANNYLLMFVGWEGVGLCSYLLIGFWYEKQSASDAGKKAFIANRIGDFGVLLAMFLVFWTFGSLTYTEVFAKVPLLRESGVLTTGLATAITLLLFLGATGKSAQIPLYVWLPDAMEGPTPVSALIHAATMVTAGVYMVARSSALFLLAPDTMMVVAVIGAVTAIFSATIGICQTDIKRVLAYSTVSQLGYMFLACGVGAFTAAIFHLMTHAFFKALLFLGSGSVIHALSGEQDMRKMGGLRKYVPVTFATMFAATLAIAGIPGLSGFFSKDEILWQAFSSSHGSPVLWGVAALAAGITAFYMFRLVFLTFFGKSRMDPEVERHAHESPWTMTVPLMILAVLSVGGGWVGIPAVLGGSNLFEHWLAPVFHPVAAAGAHGAAAAGAAEGAVHHPATLEIGLMALSVAIALCGIGLAYFLYRVRTGKPAEIAKRWPTLYDVVVHKYYIDEFYEWAVIRRIVNMSTGLWQMFDALFIDGIVNGAAGLVRAAGDRVRRLQGGVVGGYAFSLLAGAVLLVGYILYRSVVQ